MSEPVLISPGESIATVDELAEHPSMKFLVSAGAGVTEALLVRFRERCHAYWNRCPHLSLPLDWMENEFFDESGTLLICANHGALFEPDTGRCVGGPCLGRSLAPIEVDESDGKSVRLV